MISFILVLTVVVLSVIAFRFLPPIIIGLGIAVYVLMLGATIFFIKKIKREECREDDPIFMGPTKFKK